MVLSEDSSSLKTCMAAKVRTAKAMAETHEYTVGRAGRGEGVSTRGAMGRRRQTYPSCFLSAHYRSKVR